MIGTSLGPYQVVAKLGEGGMGEVYRATDTNLKRQVAIKVLPASVAGDADRLARFQREAEVLAALNHPNIAAIYGLEKTADLTALVMELVEGEDLSAHIARGPIALEEALPIAKQIADALEAAHEQGIIHRDLKPANVKVRPDGTLKVLDFGLAKAVEQGTGNGGRGAGDGARGTGDNSPTITTPAFTQAGMILGTAAYMAPEQARGKFVDRRADIWAFGAVLFEMLSGRRAFEGEDVAETLANVINREPAWEALPDDVPPHVQQVLRLCLRKSARERIPDIGAVRLALDGAFNTAGAAPSAVAPAVGPRWRRALPVAFTVIASAIAGAGAWYLKPGPPPPMVNRSSFVLPGGQAWGDEGGRMLVVSPDGARLVYVAGGRLHRRALSELEAAPIPGSEGAIAPVFSPDGESLAFFAAGSIKRMPVAGGVAVTLCPAAQPNDISWGADGIVFAANGTGILRVSPAGGSPEVLVTLKGNESVNAAEVLPGGTHVLLSLATDARRDRWDRANVIVQAIGTDRRAVVLEGASSARYVPTGHLLFARGGNLHAVTFDARRLQAGGGGTVPVVEGVRRSARRRSDLAQFGVAHSGTLLFIPGPAVESGIAQSTSRVAVSDASGKATLLALPPGPYSRPRVSPDGTRLALGVEDEQGGYVAIYDLNEQSALRRLTFGSRDLYPIWSRDSQHVTYTSDRDGRGNWALYSQRADGAGPAERLWATAGARIPVANSWSPGDTTLLFEVIENTGSLTRTLWSYTRGGRGELPFTGVQSSAVIEPVFSPDGRWVAYGANAGSATSVFVQPFPPTGALYQVPGSRLRPLWSPDGKALFYESDSGTVARVSVTSQQAVTFGNPAPVPVEVERSASGILPDGRLLFLQPVQEPADTAAPEIRIVLNWFEELKRLVSEKPR